MMLYINRIVLSIHAGNSLLHFQACLSPGKDPQKVTENVSKETTGFRCLRSAAVRVSSWGGSAGTPHSPPPGVTAAPAPRSARLRWHKCDGTQGPASPGAPGARPAPPRGTAAPRGCSWGQGESPRAWGGPCHPGGCSAAGGTLCHSPPPSPSVSVGRVSLRPSSSPVQAAAAGRARRGTGREVSGATPGRGGRAGGRAGSRVQPPGPPEPLWLWDGPRGRPGPRAAAAAHPSPTPRQGCPARSRSQASRGLLCGSVAPLAFRQRPSRLAFRQSGALPARLRSLPYGTVSRGPGRWRQFPGGGARSVPWTWGSCSATR